MIRRIRRLPFLVKAVVVVVLVALVSSGSSDPATAFGTILVAIAIIAAVWWAIGKLVRGIGSVGRLGSTKRKPAAPGRIERPATVKYVDPPGWAAPVPTPTVPVSPSGVHAPRIGDVLALTPGQFEDLMADLLRRLGYTGVQRSGGSGDLGADVVARDPQGQTTVVQCKRYAPGSTIGTPVVLTFIGMMSVHHHADRGLIVSTVGYTQPAVELARHHGVALVDGDSLLLLLHMTGTPAHSPMTAG